MGKKFSEEQGLALVRLARKTIENALGIKDEGGDLPGNPLDQDSLREKRGVFVTLTRRGQLRGCIGFLEPRESVVDAVRHNAINAAFNDPRFPPVNDLEMGDIDIEISILTEPEILEYDDSTDLLRKLRPGIDGVIIRSGLHSATFLPQVWEQLPIREEFLSHLCLKAGLPASEWEEGMLDVLTYQVEYFEEKK